MPTVRPRHSLFLAAGLAAIAASAALGLALAPSLARATPTYYTDEAEFLAASSSLVTENFDAAPWVGDTSYPGTMSNLGITWSAANALRASTFAPHSGSVSLSDVDGSSDQLDRLTAELSGNVGAFGVWLRSGQWLADIEFSVYATDGSLIASFAQTFFDQWTFVGFTTDVALGRVEMRATRGGGIYADDFLIDDVRLGRVAAPTHTVPEPASWWLVLAGTLGLLTFRDGRPLQGSTTAGPDPDEGFPMNRPLPASCAYVLRLVSDPAVPERLAGRLEHVASGRRHDFDDAEALLACLRHEQRCAEARVDGRSNLEP